MNKVILQRRPMLGIWAALAAALALVIAPGTASAAQPYAANGVVNACYKAKGKSKGALRLVKSTRSCKRARGWRPVSWSAVGPQGAPGASGAAGQTGSAGPTGPEGPPGQQGEQGSPGLIGGVEQSLLDTIQAQADQIAALTAQVNSLTGDLVDLEDVVASACDQIGLVTERSDELLDTLENGTIGGSLPIVGSVVGLLELVLTGLPEEPLGSFEGCTA